MLVSKILQSKGDDGVLSVSSSATIADAVKILGERRIGTVVISDDGQVPLGILSERDVVRIIATKGAAVLQDSVADHMTKRLVESWHPVDALQPECGGRSAPESIGLGG